MRCWSLDALPVVHPTEDCCMRNATASCKAFLQRLPASLRCASCLQTCLIDSPCLPPAAVLDVEAMAHLEMLLQCTQSQHLLTMLPAVERPHVACSMSFFTRVLEGTDLAQLRLFPRGSGRLLCLAPSLSQEARHAG